jgi:hypothetical protein
MKVVDLEIYKEARDFFKIMEKAYPGRTTLGATYEFMAEDPLDLIAANKEADEKYPQFRHGKKSKAT